MIYSFYCRTCQASFEVEMSREKYASHSAHYAGTGRWVAEYFQCTLCGSRDTQRSYNVAIPVHFVGSGFTKTVKKQEE